MATTGERNSDHRTVVSPGDLEDTFLELAEENTRKCTETMGILLGSAHSDHIKIEKLVLPKQKGTTCEVLMLKDERLDMLQIESELVTVGWIHTHPTQTAFLSSVDLHTDQGMQCLLPEAVAVVCAPRYGTNKWFRLTPKGLNIVENCSLRGFHEHASKAKLFDSALGIVFDSRQIEVIDLRGLSTVPVLGVQGEDKAVQEEEKKEER